MTVTNIKSFKLRPQHQKKYGFLATTLVMILVLNACAGTSTGSNTIAGYGSPMATTSPKPEYLAAQATLAAGQAEAQNLANQATSVALDIAQAAATEAYFTRQTASAAEAQATINVQATQQAIRDALTATQAANNAYATQAAEITQTADAILTATSWPQTATPLAATQAAIAADVEETERRAYWSQFVIPFWVFIGAVIILLVIAAAVYTFLRLLPALELRFRTIISPDGEVITYLPAGNIRTILPGRTAGPALHSGADESVVSGLASDLMLQDRALDRHQTIRLAATLPKGKTTQQVKRTAAAEFPETGPDSPTYRILDRGEQPPILDAETMEYLEGSWRDSND